MTTGFRESSGDGGTGGDEVDDEEGFAGGGGWGLLVGFAPGFECLFSA